MWETVELREIRVFLALAEELHFGRAAETLGITQSRVSQSLRELELKIGETLLHRTSRRVQLTTAGERFLAEVRPAHQRLAATLRRAHQNGGATEETVRIGLLNAVPGGRPLVQVINAFEERRPSCKVEVRELRLSDRFEPLHAGDVDVMASPPPLEQPDLVVGPVLSRERRVLAVAVDHPLSGRTGVTTEDIADYEVVDVDGLLPPELASVLIPAASTSGRPIKRRRLEHHDWSELNTMIARGKIVHPTFAGQFADPGIRCVEITDMPFWTSVLVWRRHDPAPQLRAFIEVADATLRATPVQSSAA